MMKFGLIGRQAQSAVGRFATLALLAIIPAGSLQAQVRTVDPNNAIDADLAPGAPASNPSAPGVPTSSQPSAAAPQAAQTAAPPPPLNQNGATGYQKDDVIGAAEGVFGKGAEGLASLIEKILKDQGQPIGYITGREASGAIGVGLRYGSGTLHHKIEGARDVYWTGPSLGFDLGGNAGSTFVLVYNLFDTQQLYKRYPAIEGQVYIVGGFTASYLRRDKVVLIPIRAGVGWRLGANVGYMKFSEKRKILPF